MLDKLYDYQRDAVEAALSTDLGTIVLPTGTGKTICQAAIITSDIQSEEHPHIYVINCPRILLSFQLLKEIYFFLTASGIDARYMFVHSGESADINEMEEIRRLANKENKTGNVIKFGQIESTTSPTEIESMIIRSKINDLPLIIFSTYHSCARIEVARMKSNQKIRMMINDEAHYLTQEGFHQILSTVEAEKKYFFTATARYTPSNEGRGMNNTEKYGNIVYEMNTLEAIDRGKMVRPRIHTFFSSDIHTFNDFQQSISKIIYEAFHHHEYAIKDLDALPKILISAKGVGDIKKFLESEEYQKLRNEDVDIFAVASSDQIGNDINGEKVQRGRFLRKLKQYGEEEDRKVIVLHYDILAEGIDVSGFTAILPLRTLPKSKFLQTYGRCARLHPDDRKAFSERLYKPDDLKVMKKPYAYVLAPNVAEGNEDDYQNITSIIEAMREIDFSCVEHIIVTENVNGVIEDIPVDGFNDISIKIPKLGEIIKKIESELEDEAIASLQGKARMAYTVRSIREAKAKKYKKVKVITDYIIYNSKDEIRNEQGVRSGLSTARNAKNDIASFILNKAGATSIEKNAYYCVDGPNEFFPESWEKLMKAHPEFKGKYLMPIYDYIDKEIV
jgi:superfamily II DNA or RNA helicase